ncbi:MAG TPA: hypothetical protein VM935_19490, partial [Chitinophagaceae bacterium]|nr:hypothetical protein [Chitinophagaceae bacterium]
MKDILLSFCIALLCFSNAVAQTTPVPAGEIILYHGKDSVNIFLNKDYYLIEDSCAEIIRLGHFNQITKKFAGSFKDISSANRQQVIAKGNYDEEGMKEGNFICYYLNGNVQARGNFKNNVFSGKWDFFYPDGKPKITFVA